MLAVRSSKQQLELEMTIFCPRTQLFSVLRIIVSGCLESTIILILEIYGVSSMLQLQVWDRPHVRSHFSPITGHFWFLWDAQMNMLSKSRVRALTFHESSLLQSYLSCII